VCLTVIVVYFSTATVGNQNCVFWVLNNVWPNFGWHLAKAIKETYWLSAQRMLIIDLCFTFV